MPGFITGLVVEVAIQSFTNAAGNLIYDALKDDSFKNFMRRFAPTPFLEALKSIYREFEDNHPNLLSDQRQRIRSSLEELEREIEFLGDRSQSQELEAVDSIDALLRYYFRGAPPELVSTMKDRLEDMVVAMIWEELLTDEEIYGTLQSYLHQRVDEIIRRLSNTPEVRRRMQQVEPQVEALVSMEPRGSGRALPAGTPLEKMMNDLVYGDIHQRARAAQQLLSFRGDRVVAQLKKFLDSSDEELRLYATFILSTIRPSEVIPNLVDLASSYSATDVRAYARHLLDTLQSVEAIERLAECFMHQMMDRKLETVQQALVRIGPRAIPALKNVLKQCARRGQEKWSCVTYATYTLYQIKPLESRKWLEIIAMRHPKREIRERAKGLLSNIS